MSEFDIVASSGDGKREAALPISVGPSPPVDKCPVVFLGAYGGRVVFAMPDGTIRDEAASKISSMLRTDIFACPDGRDYLTAWVDVKDGRFKREDAAAWFNDTCRKVGFYDTERLKRKIGVWLGDDGEVILHRGREVWVFRGVKYKTYTLVEMIRNAGDGPLYEVQPSTPAPTKPPKSPDRQWLRHDLNLWQFEPIGKGGLTGADIVTGFIGAGMLGAVAPFRGHVLISAQAGSGKTTLLDFVQKAMGAIAPPVTNDFSPAGLKNELGGRARPILLDEAEASENVNGPGSIEAALEYLRRMSTGSGGMRKQGDIGGKTTTHYIIGSAMMAAINPPKLQPADASRFLEIRLAPLRTDQPNAARPTGDVAVQAALERAKHAGPALLGLALRNADRYRSDFKLLKSALVERHQSPRAADLVASIAAGRRMMLHDEALDLDEAFAEVDKWAPLLEVRAQTEKVENNGLEALEHLLAFEAVRGPPKSYTVGEIVDQFFAAPTDADHQKDNLRRIRRMGIIPTTFDKLKCKSISVPDEKMWLVIANKNPELDAFFSRTKWKDYRNCFLTLNHLSEEYRTSLCEPIKFFAGSTHRAIAIPYTPHYGGDAPSPIVAPVVSDEDVDFAGGIR